MVGGTISFAKEVGQGVKRQKCKTSRTNPGCRRQRSSAAGPIAGNCWWAKPGVEGRVETVKTDGQECRSSRKGQKGGGRVRFPQPPSVRRQLEVLVG